MAVGYSKLSVLKTYMRPSGKTIYDGMSILLQMFRQRKDSVELVAMSFYSVLMIFSTNLLPPDAPDDEDDPNIFLYPSPQLFVLMDTFLTKDKKMCARARCSNATTSTTASLRLCSGCHLVAYCSVACQREAWVWKPTPHKAVCKDFAKLAKIHEKSSGADDFDRRLEAQGFGDEKIRDLILAVSMPQQTGMDQILAMGPDAINRGV
ncbi:hypothetical protein B0H10DRAFT_926509 [Mycena sp. CBHHK59/15]|nr:hypothetical protein B0H10DRAFT_926509 [Mycena sp. CBHHK59/15]